MPKNDFYANQVKDKDELLYIMRNAVTLELHVEDFKPVKDFYQKNGFYLCFTEKHDWIFNFKGYATNEDN